MYSPKSSSASERQRIEFGNLLISQRGPVSFIFTQYVELLEVSFQWGTWLSYTIIAAIIIPHLNGGNLMKW